MNSKTESLRQSFGDDALGVEVVVVEGRPRVAAALREHHPHLLLAGDPRRRENRRVTARGTVPPRPIIVPEKHAERPPRLLGLDEGELGALRGE